MFLNGKFQCNICIYKSCSRHDGPSDPVSHMKINDHQNHFSNNGRQRINAQRQLDLFYLIHRMERIGRLLFKYLVSVPLRNTFTKWTYIGRINKFHSAVPTFIHNTHHYFLLLPEYHLPPDNGKMLSAVLYPSSQMRSWMSAFHYRNKGTSSDSVLWNVTK